MRKTLTANQRRFCEEYVQCYSATRAYIRAYTREGYTPDYDVAKSQGYKFLRSPVVMEYIKELQHEALARYGDLSELIARELMDDIIERDKDGKHNSAWHKSVDLLQKQLGLQSTKVSADVNAKEVIDVKISDD